MTIIPIEDKNSDFKNVFLHTNYADKNPTPHCKKHGAMNKVSIFKDNGGYWRCCTTDGIICRSGCIQIINS